MDRPRRVLLVASLGGHLSQLKLLAPAFDGDERTWVTFAHDGFDADGDRVVFCHSPTTRNVPNLIRNLRLAWRLLREVRPDVIVSTGAGAAVPFFLLARTVDARSVFIEVYDRMETRTLTGRLVKPFADAFLLQWPEQQRTYDAGEVIGPVYNVLEKPRTPPPDAPTLIARHAPAAVFVTAGTDHHPFDRLIRWAAKLAAQPGLRVFAQRGTSAAPPDASQSGSGLCSRPLLAADELAMRLNTADAVVCHGGPSTIVEAIAAGHRPVVVARQPHLGEHVDDHQVRFCRALADRGVITLVDDYRQTEEAVHAAIAAPRRPRREIAAPPTTLDAFGRVLDRLSGGPR